MTSILIIGRHVSSTNVQQTDINNCIIRLTSDLQEQGYQVTVDGVASPALPNLSAQYDFALIVGGDGTMIGAARDLAYVAGYEPPIKLIGINAGRLGFVTDLPLDVDSKFIIEMIEGKYKLEERRILECLGQKAMNEVVFKSTNGSVLDFSVTIDESFAYKARADGLLITTPTGSTAYATSANGAILFPTARVLEIIPLLPQTLSHRPLVINDDVIIEVTIHRGQGTIYHDGINHDIQLEHERTYTVKLSEHIAMFCHPLAPNAYDFFRTLREKLFWHLEPGTKL